MDLATLTTARLAGARLDADDFDALHWLHSDPHVMRTLLRDGNFFSPQQNSHMTRAI